MSWRILYGFGGCGNFGDDYMLDRWISYYGDNRADLSLCVVRPDRWLESFYSASSNFSLETGFHEIFRRAVETLRGVTEDHIEHNILAGKKAALDILSSEEHRGRLLELEAIQFFGGGYWNKRYAEPWGMAALLSEISFALNVPLIATGVGVTPVLQKNRQSVDEIISRFDLIEVRDIESYEEFSRKYPCSNIVFGSDDTFITPVRVEGSPENTETSINICVQSNLAGDESHDRILNRILKFIDGYEGTFDIKYLQFHDGPDQVFFKKLEAALGIDIRVYTKTDMLRNGLPIKKNDVCISTRFHLHLLAARVGAKGAYVATGDDYYSVKHKSVCDLGSDWLDLLNSTQCLEDMLKANFDSIDEKRERAMKLSRLSGYI
ncbi:polysaccharide pyruvyl transferase family protein [Sulfitobacter faviae]|uniref:polysaccharide pyruvyl transferase family protein n=1 Tax=Sulfitobacter faviae TaxID=1775881 RepID=UPI0024560A7C|nr:hypothetical protein [Sulfitobacter faviae]